MAKALPDTVYDQALAKIATSTRLCICSSQPANYAGISAVLLASVTMTAGTGNGDYTIADGSVSGRRVRVLAQTAVSISASGTATYVTLDDGTTLLAATTCTSQALTSGGTVDVPEWKVEMADPT